MGGVVANPSYMSVTAMTTESLSEEQTLESLDNALGLAERQQAATKFQNDKWEMERNVLAGSVRYSGGSCMFLSILATNGSFAPLTWNFARFLT
jgi:hypothetical protein